MLECAGPNHTHHRLTMKIRRRHFLHLAFASAAPLGACSSESSDVTPDADGSAPPADSGISGDTGSPDAGGVADVVADAATPDATAEVCPPGSGNSEMVGPYWMHLAGDTALVRFILRGTAGACVNFGEGYTTPATLTSFTDEVEFEWPDPIFEAPFPDVPGTYTRHEAAIPLGESGLPIPFRIVEQSGAAHEGACPPPPRGRPIRVAWVADTMTGIFESVAQRILEQEPDIVIHGGDIQYSANPFDTWLGFFENLRPVLAKAYFHVCIGNHEFDDYDNDVDEFESMYRRFFDNQTGPGTGVSHHELRLGQTSWLLLNSEQEFENVDGEQHRWMRERIDAANADPDVAQVIACYHRPMWTFGRSFPRPEARANVHSVFVEKGVKVAFAGHEHSYQRFLVDGVNHIVDGGGGASGYDPDLRLPTYELSFPEEIPLRQTKSRTHGICVVDIAEDGSIEVFRITDTGQEVDRFTVGV